MTGLVLSPPTTIYDQGSQPPICDFPNCPLLAAGFFRSREPCGRGGIVGRLDLPHENLCRAAVRSFRRHAFLRSRWRAAEIVGGSAALAVRQWPAAADMARMGAEPVCRYPAAARQR